jgi:hypothetical protein
LGQSVTRFEISHRESTGSAMAAVGHPDTAGLAVKFEGYRHNSADVGFRDSKIVDDWPPVDDEWLGNLDSNQGYRSQSPGFYR